eukprot:TRINITY_DN213_c0_g1_i1.p1 TRINITY_DN213_c0_g1~~TRINITY_DN213_c0_g1_i1.p1  ORF type:complete len:770 (+),score=118.16 TRINITY_DN213_c0_g1_i1:41-2311(+)
MAAARGCGQLRSDGALDCEQGRSSGSTSNAALPASRLQDPGAFTKVPERRGFAAWLPRRPPLRIWCGRLAAATVKAFSHATSLPDASSRATGALAPAEGEPELTVEPVDVSTVRLPAAAISPKRHEEAAVNGDRSLMPVLDAATAGTCSSSTPLDTESDTASVDATAVEDTEDLAESSPHREDCDSHSPDEAAGTAVPSTTCIGKTSPLEDSRANKNSLQLLQRTSPSLESVVRHVATLGEKHSLHPPKQPCIFVKLTNALAFVRALEERGEYRPGQLGIFARDLSKSGAKDWLVDTFAGFALRAVPGATLCGNPAAKRHLYEVILEGRPCWLYFDLEFSRGANPDIAPDEIMCAFYDTLSAFFVDMFGAPLDMTSVYELDSSTQDKFSKHVIVKRLQSQDGLSTNGAGEQDTCCVLAFESNEQVGFVVGRFIEFASSRKAQVDSLARLLFLNKERKGCDGEMPQQISLVDQGVYTRNRCFRVLFSSKFGKHRPLLPVGRMRSESSPELQLLNSLASYVPHDTPMMRHKAILDMHSEIIQCSGVGRRPVRGLRRSEVEISISKDLANHLVSEWDAARSQNESLTSYRQETIVQKCIEIEDDSLVVALTNNRFCFHKGASHKSNGVYLVVDRRRGTFHQKCHDPDCRSFRSQPFSLPCDLAAQLWPQLALTQPASPLPASPLPASPVLALPSQAPPPQAALPSPVPRSSAMRVTTPEDVHELRAVARPLRPPGDAGQLKGIKRRRICIAAGSLVSGS